MSKTLKLRRNGELFELSHYPTMYRAPGEPEPVRARREKETTKVKQKINARESSLSMLRYVHANYRTGRDLFVSLSFALDLTPKQARDFFSKFSRLIKPIYREQWKKLPAKMRRSLKTKGIDGEYRYISTMEDHNRQDEPINLHFHCFMSCNPNRRISALKLISDIWQQACGEYAGSVKVETLTGDDLMTDSVKYFLKQRRPKGAKRWSKSRNHREPEAAIRRRMPDRDIPDAPPGTKWIDGNYHFNDFGCYGWMICRIIDKRVFNRWYNRQSKAKI